MSETTPPSDYTEDTDIWPLMVELRDCLCETLTTRGLMPGDCFCGIVPGQQATWDYMTGMAWVRLDSVVPSAVFPNQSFDLNNCGTTLAAEIEVGVIQCTPGPSADGSPPSQLQQFESSRLQIATMAAIRSAILCCDDNSDLDLILGAYEPQGPNGNLVGGTWRVSVGRA
jgi:hypothetical protein